MRVVVKMKSREFVASETGFTSSDCCPSIMQSMFAFLGLPYAEKFVCGSIEIRRPQRKTSPFAKRPGVQTPWKPVDEYGSHAFILNDASVLRIRLVCAGDFQNVVCQLVAEILTGKTLAEVREFALNERFRPIAERTPLDKVEEVLRWADRNKGSWPYAEVRLLQPLREEDGSWA
jgi:hypothetical protein